jgi:20S proteasome alpha/beta subunit
MQTIKENYHQNMSLEDAQKLVLQTLKQVMEEKITTDNVEMCVIPKATMQLEFKSNEYITGVLAGLN